MTFTENNVGGVVFMTSPVIKARHAFSTRYGGVSTGALSSLNFSTQMGDEPANIVENYRRFGSATGVNVSRMAFTRQVHGSTVRIVTEADVHTLLTDVPYEADGLVTDIRKLALICFTADCVPVLLCDDVNGVIAAVHCGWRSSVADILGKTVRNMKTLGAKTENICAAIGPAISRCCFEVGEEVVEAAREYLGGDLNGLCFPEEGRPGKFFLDLKGANARRLVQLGLRGDNISVSDECTMCSSEKYWSHRKTHGERGSQASVIVLD